MHQIKVSKSRKPMILNAALTGARYSPDATSAQTEANTDLLIGLISKLKENVVALRDEQARNLAMSGEHPEIIKCLQDDLERRYNKIMEGLESLESAIQRKEVSRGDVTNFELWLSTMTQAIKGFFGFMPG